MNFVTRKYIPRRRVLRAMGVTLGLPFLDAMAPAQTATRKTAAAPPSRLACIEMVHGAAGSTPEGQRKHYWSPVGAGADFEFSYSLEPLAPFRDYVTIISGTDSRQAEAFLPSEGGADHFRSSAVFLTAAHPKQGPEVSAGISIDQVYAQQAGRDTRVPSIQLAIENLALPPTCGFEYSCVYSETISWASATEPLPMTVNPRVVFEQLFGKRQGGSVLDGFSEPSRELRNQLGPKDGARLEDFLEEVRAVERHIQMVERRNALAETRERYAAPLGVPDSWEEHVTLMFDLQVLAFATDTTRVSTLKLSRDTNNRVFARSGVNQPFHTLSHHNQAPQLIAQFAKLNRYHVGMVPYFLRKLKNTPDGDGSLLDHSLVLYGSSMGDSNAHNHRRVPLFLAGHAGGRVKGNLHCVCPEGTPQANALLTVMHRLGVDVASVGDSTGEISI